MKNRKWLAILIAICILTTALFAYAEPNGGTPPEKPSGEMGNPPSGEPMGTPPSGAPGDMGNPPSGEPGGMGGGQSGQPESYSAVKTVREDAELSDETIESTGTDENALLVTGGNVTLDEATIARASSDSTGGDASSFYGVGAAVLAAGGTLSISNASISTDANGGAGAFAYGDGTIEISDSTITTEKDTSGGIHVAGGTLHTSNLTVVTEGNSSSAIRSDRGGGTMTVDGGSYTSNGSGSPAVYVTADIDIANATLTANGSEALCLEGKNSVTLTDCTLTGNTPDQDQNDNTWTVILYQSMSGDSEVGEGKFEMTGGTLVSENGGVFYTTNTDSEFTLKNVSIQTADDCEYLLRITGNQNARGWGQTGSNGANCTFTAIEQALNGNVLVQGESEWTITVEAYEA